jgi:copper/silver efflux system protein
MTSHSCALLQDWFLRYELKTLPNVAEVAPIGGMVKQYQVVLDPVRMASRGVTQQQIAKAIDEANRETGGSVLELAETEFMVRATGYLETLKDFRAIPLRLDGGVPVTLGDVAHIQLGPEMRRGIASLTAKVR